MCGFWQYISWLIKDIFNVDCGGKATNTGRCSQPAGVLGAVISKSGCSLRSAESNTMEYKKRCCQSELAGYKSCYSALHQCLHSTFLPSIVHWPPIVHYLLLSNWKLNGSFAWPPCFGFTLYKIPTSRVAMSAVSLTVQYHVCAEINLEEHECKFQHLPSLVVCS